MSLITARKRPLPLRAGSCCWRSASPPSARSLDVGAHPTNAAVSRVISRGRTKAVSGAQSSKRELLSRGRELRGAGRELLAPPLGRADGPLPLEADELGRADDLLLKAASSASLRIGLPLGTP